MNDKQRIEEFCKHIANVYRRFLEDENNEIDEQGYRKLSEGAVVIPNKITEETSPETLIKIEKYNEKIRKGTAKEILTKGYQYLMNSTDKAVAFACFLGIIEHDYGVEIKE